VLAGRPKAQVAAELGVSVKTVDKWLRRYQQEGPAGLEDRRSRPHTSPHRIPAALARAVIALRRERWTMARIAQVLGLSRASVARILKRAGLNRLSRLQPAAPVQRYERARPGELLHLDVKKLGAITQAGHRIVGRQRRGPRGAGWEYVHVAIDDAARVAYAQTLPDETADSATAFLRAAVAYYAGLGVQIQAVMTDNAPAYYSRSFTQACRDLGIKQLYTKPYTPRTNGKAERFIQSALREWAYARAYTHSRQRTAALAPWLHSYNWHRPHASLAGQPPITRLGLDRNNLLRLHS
jgi:transposase InsO family protein